MDLATKHANEMLLAGKEALEAATHLKKEYRQTVTESLQTLYETVLALSDSRTRHKYNLEVERARHAKELVRVERAHTKANNSLIERVVNELVEARKDLSENFEETKGIRTWLGYETVEPYSQIKNLDKNWKTMSEGIQQLLNPPKTASSEEHQTLANEHKELKNTVGALSNQIDHLRRENGRLQDQLKRNKEI